MKLLITALAVFFVSGCATIQSIEVSPTGACKAEGVFTVMKSADEVNICGASAKNTQSNSALAEAIVTKILTK